jgi:hypothetical protein
VAAFLVQMWWPPSVLLLMVLNWLTARLSVLKRKRRFALAFFIGLAGVGNRDLLAVTPLTVRVATDAAGLLLETWNHGRLMGVHGLGRKVVRVVHRWHHHVLWRIINSRRPRREGHVRRRMVSRVHRVV